MAPLAVFGDIGIRGRHFSNFRRADGDSAWQNEAIPPELRPGLFIYDVWKRTETEPVIFTGENEMRTPGMLFTLLMILIVSPPTPPAHAAPPAKDKEPTGRTVDEVGKAYAPSRNVAMTLDEFQKEPPVEVKVVTANVFAVTDQAGNVRAEMGARDGEATIRMFDAQGEPRLVLADADGGTTITLLAGEGRE